MCYDTRCWTYPVPEGAEVPIDLLVGTAAAVEETFVGAAVDGVTVTVE